MTTLSARSLDRRLVLAAYMTVMACVQVMWLSYAPVTREVAQNLGVSVEDVGWFAECFSGIYLLMSLPAGRWLDQHFTRSLDAGVGLIALGGIVRALAPHSYGVQMGGQVLMAIGQPMVLNAVNPLAARYFPVAERPAAIAAGSASQFVGMLLASLTSPLLYSRLGLGGMLWVQAGLTLLSGLWMVWAAHTPHTFFEHTAHLAEEKAQSLWDSFLGMVRDPVLLRLGGILVVGFGVFTSLSTWIEPLLAHHGVDAEHSGILMGLMVLTGIIGSATLPVLAAKHGKRRAVLGLGVLGCLSAAFAVGWLGSLPALAVVLGLAGLCIIACLPVVLEWAQERVGPGQQGSVVGFLMFTGHIGALALMILVGRVASQSAAQAGMLLAAPALLGILALATLPRERRPA